MNTQLEYLSPLPYHWKKARVYEKRPSSREERPRAKSKGRVHEVLYVKASREDEEAIYEFFFSEVRDRVMNFDQEVREFISLVS